MSDQLWIVIPNWDRFQHYKDRDPAWIKTYPRLLSSDAYRGLSLACRGVLHGLWMEYARSNAEIPLNTRELSARMSGKVLRKHLEALNHAGFIEVSASKPLALRALAREEVLRTSSESASAPAQATGARASAQKKNDPAAALAEAHDLAAGWTGGDSDEFEQALDRIARKHHARIGSLERAQLWDIAFGS